MAPSTFVRFLSMCAPRAAALGLAATLAACAPAPDAPTPADHPVATDAATEAAADASAPDASAPDASAPDASAPDASAPDASAPDIAPPDAPDGADAPDAPDADDASFPCGPSSSCPTGYRCVGLATTQCVRAAPLGAFCRSSPDPIFCIPGADCVPTPEGPRCAAYGALHGICRNTDCAGRCDPGLGCNAATHCVPGLPVGALCGATGDVCNEGGSCQSVDGTARCVADGARGGHCHDDRRCDAGLRCHGSNGGSATGCNRAYFHCVAGLQAGEVCAPGDVCPAGTRCVMSRGATRCEAAPEGAAGGRCRSTSPACDDGAVCDGSGWTCVRRVERGMACDPTGATTACATGDTCDAEHRADRGRCVATGTAAGADCRTTGAACDGALQCSTFSRYRRTCRAVARVGDPCDLGAVRTLCPESTRCLPTTVTAEGSAVAACTAPIAEVEPNERVAAARTVVTRSTLVQATLAADDAEDCHAVRMTAGSALFVEASAGLVAQLYRASGDELGRWTLPATAWDGPLSGVARLDPAAIGALRNVTAGDYLLCVRAPAALPTALRYTLALGVLPRSW